MSIKAACSWGEGPDIIVEINGPVFILGDRFRTEYQEKGWNEMELQVDLTQKEARELAAQLILAADQCKHLEDQLDILNEREAK